MPVCEQLVEEPVDSFRRPNLSPYSPPSPAASPPLIHMDIPNEKCLHSNCLAGFSTARGSPNKQQPQSLYIIILLFVDTLEPRSYNPAPCKISLLFTTVGMMAGTKLRSDLTDEENLSTEQSETKAHSRISRAYGDPWRPQSHQRETGKGSQATQRLSAPIS